MTEPHPGPQTVKLGPGTLMIGATGTEIDLSCQMTGAVVSWAVDTGDDTTVLCGDTVPGDRTYTSTIAGTMYQDLADAEGIVAFSWTNKGSEQPFTYMPNNAAEATVTGNLVVDPLDVGSTEDYGTKMTSNFEWSIVGEPALGWPEPAGFAG